MKKIIIILSFLVAYINCFCQTYNPSLHTVSNKSYGMAQYGPTDARSYFYDQINFVYRPYATTNEVLSYLNLSKYRSGNVLIIIDSGGVLQPNGTFIGGINMIYMFKDGTADANLIKLNLTGSGGGGGPGSVTTVTSTPGGGITFNITNPTTTPNITPSVTLGGDISGVSLSAMTVARFNGQLPSFYQNYNNLFNTPVIPAQFNPIAGVGMATSGAYPNITFTNTTASPTAGTYIKITGGSVINLDTAAYRKVDSVYSVNDSTLAVVINGSPYLVTVKGGTHGGGGGGSGTVTIVTGSNVNGVTWTITNPTSNPDLTIALGAITPTSVNALVLASLTNGFSITGGTTPAILTVPSNATVSGTNTGNVSLAGENYLSIVGQVITANAVNLSNTNATGTLAAGRFPALTGPITTSAGSLVTSVTNNAITNAMLAQMAAGTIKGNNTGALGNALDLSGTQATAMLDVFTTSVKGLVPAASGGSTTTQFLRKDGTWIAPPGVAYTAGIGINGTLLGTGVIALDTANLHDTLRIRQPGTGGDSLAYVIGGTTLAIARLRPGTNVTMSIGADSSVTINSSGGGGATTKTILCTACGFAVGDVVSKSASTWVKSDTISNYPDAVVTTVVDANHFVLTTSGPMLWVAHGKTIGSNYFLSTTAGATTTTSPVISFPIFKPIATDTILVAIERGYNFAGGGGGGSATLTSTQVGYGDVSNVLTGEAAFNYNATTNKMVIDSIGAKRIVLSSNSADSFMVDVQTSKTTYGGMRVINTNPGSAANLQLLRSDYHGWRIYTLGAGTNASVAWVDAGDMVFIKDPAANIIIEQGPPGGGANYMAHWDAAEHFTLWASDDGTNHGPGFWNGGPALFRDSVTVADQGHNYAIMAATHFHDNGAYVEGVGWKFFGVTQAGGTGVLLMTLDSTGKLTLPFYGGSGTQGLQVSNTGVVSISGSGAPWTSSGNAFGATGTFGTTDNFDISYVTNNTIRGHWDKGGNIEFGTTVGAPTDRVHITGTLGVSSTINSAGNVSFGNTAGIVASANTNSIQTLLGNNNAAAWNIALLNSLTTPISGQSLIKVATAFAITANTTEESDVFALKPVFNNSSVSGTHTQNIFTIDPTNTSLTNTVVRAVKIVSGIVAVNTTSGKTLIGSATDLGVAQLEITKTSAQLALIYDATHYNLWSTSSAGNLTITPTGGTDITLAHTNVNLKHIVGTGSAPSTNSLGTNVTSATPSGTDNDFKLTVVTSGIVTGTICNIAPATNWGATPVVVFSSQDVNTGNACTLMWGGGTSTSNYTFGGTISGAGTYIFNFHVAQ